MAGKTSRGIGGGEDVDLSRDAAPLIADEDDAQGLHSGPTVVDDKKVEEVLRKLRSLDKPPGPLTGITQAVPETGNSEPTRVEAMIELETAPHRVGEADASLMKGTPAPLPKVIASPGLQSDPGPAKLNDLMYPLQRPTAIGRSPATPVVEQAVGAPVDLARGTLFGRGVHLPSVDAPEEIALDDAPSGPAVQFLPGSPLAAAAQEPFPPAERPPLPSIAPPAHQFHVPFDADSHTQLVDPPRSKVKRVFALLSGFAIVGLGFYGWTLWKDGHLGSVTPPAQAVAPPAPPPAPPPAAPPAAQPAAAAPAAAAPTAAAPAPAPAAAAPAAPPAPAAQPAAAEEPAAAAAPAPPKAPPARAKRSGTSASRRSGGHSTAPATAKAPAPEGDDNAEEPKPSKPHKKGAVPEDPDGTMAPSL